MSIELIIQSFRQIVAARTGSDPVLSRIANRVFVVRAPENTALPLIVVNVTRMQPIRYFSGPADLSADVNLMIWGSAAEVHRFEDHLVTAMDQRTLAITGFANGRCLLIERGRAEVRSDATGLTSRWRITAMGITGGAS